MKIKIPAQTRKTISDEVLNRDVKPFTKKGTNQHQEKSNNSIIIAKHITGENKVYQSLAININNKKYISALANPVHLFLSTAIEMYELSEIRKLEDFPKYVKKDKNSSLFLLDFNSGYTNEYFNDYLKSRITSIIMLVSALECFMNQIIPNDFECDVISNGNILSFKNKEEIESPQAYFKIKIEQIIPKAIKQEEFWESNEEILKVLNGLYKQRNKFIHLKTHSEEELERYSSVFADMINFDILKAIKATVKFMNMVKSGFIEEE